jgi:hypothetical protein
VGAASAAAAHPVEPGGRCPVTGKLIDTFAPGDLLDGKFEIVRELARGGMGVVYVARHLALGRQVAVKVLLGELASDLDLAARFEQEARASSAIGHPNIIHVYDLGRTSGGLLYMVMELLEGQSLAALLADAGKLPVSRALRLIDQVLSALAAAHKNGIVHRDLKPDNIFVVQTEYQPDFVKLLDFGISKILAAHAGHLGKDRKQTRMGTVMGTPEYMAPEQAAGNVDQVDARTDLYATGVVLYELICGETPFQGENYNAVMAAIILGTHPRARERRPSLSPHLDQVIETAIASARERRYASAAAMRDALVAAQRAEPGHATGAAPVLELDDADDEPSAPARAPGTAGPPVLELLPEVAYLATAPPPEAFMPASIAAAPAPVPRAAPGAAAAARRDPFAAPDDAPESVLMLESEARRAHGTPRPMPAVASPAAARTTARPARAAPAPLRRGSPPILGRLLVGVALLAILGGGGFVAFRHFKDRLPFVGPPSVAVAFVPTPADAELRVDDAPVAALQATLRAGRHAVLASAPGYVTRRIDFVAASGVRVPVLLLRAIAPVAAADPALAGVAMPAPVAADAAPPVADADATLVALARVRECLGQIHVHLGAAASDANLHWSLDAAARCLEGAHVGPAAAEVDAAASAEVTALRTLAGLSRSAADGRRGKPARAAKDLAAAFAAAAAADASLRRALVAREEATQQALLATLEHATGRGFGFAARRYVLAVEAAWRRATPASADVAYAELIDVCKPRHACQPLLLAAIAFQQQPGVDTLNALIGAYDAAVTD